MKSLILFSFLFTSLITFCQYDGTGKSIINKELIYSFGEGSRLIIISSDSTLFWRDRNKPKEANEKTKTMHINNHTIMTSWYNSEKTFVTILSDFDKLKVTGMVCWPDGNFYPLEGTIEIKEK